MFGFWNRNKQRSRPYLRFDPQTPVMGLPRDHPFRLEDAYRHVMFTGMTGSGKSVLSQKLAMGLLKAGASFAVACVKPEEANLWHRLCRIAGREQDFIRLAPHKTEFELDLIAYEHQRGAGVESTVYLLNTLSRLVNRSQSSGQENQAFWMTSHDTVLRQVLTVLWFGSAVTPTTSDLYRLLTTLPTDREFCRQTKFQESFLAELFRHALSQPLSEEIQTRLLRAYQYLTDTYAGLSDKTRSVIDSMVRNTLEPIVSTEAASVLACGRVSMTPEQCIAQGKVVVFDWPVLVGHEPARTWNALMTLLFQRAGLARIITPETPPLVVWRDEYATLALGEQDAIATLTGRSQRVCNVILFQTIPAAVSALGGTEVARNELLTVIGNHGIKFLGNSTCPETNRFFSTLIGDSRQYLMSGSANQNDWHPLDDFRGIVKSSGAGFSEQWLPLVRPEEFAHLQIGEFIVHQAGRTFASGESFTQVQFEESL